MIGIIWVIACTTTIPWALFFDTVMTPIGEDQEVLMCREVSEKLVRSENCKRQRQNTGMDSNATFC